MSDFLFDNFFDLYPKGFCLFLLVGPDKSILFGPGIEINIFNYSERIIEDLRQSLRFQIAHNENTMLYKPIALFFAEKTGFSKKEAASQAKSFQFFFNNAVMNDPDLCMEPIYLNRVSYNGYKGGMSVEKKKDFAMFIKTEQKELELAPRQRVTLNVKPSDEALVCPTFPKEQIIIQGDEKIIKEIVYDNVNYVVCMASFVAFIMAFVPLFFAAFWI